jgi:hypothetical protein
MIEDFGGGQGLGPDLQGLLVLIELVFNLVKLQAALVFLYVLACLH